MVTPITPPKKGSTNEKIRTKISNFFKNKKKKIISKKEEKALERLGRVLK